MKHRLWFSAACGTKATFGAMQGPHGPQSNLPDPPTTSVLGSPAGACICQAWSGLQSFVSAVPSTWRAHAPFHIPASRN